MGHVKPDQLRAAQDQFFQEAGSPTLGTICEKLPETLRELCKRLPPDILSHSLNPNNPHHIPSGFWLSCHNAGIPFNAGNTLAERAALTHERISIQAMMKLAAH